MKSLSLIQPHLLVTVGIPGSGKSFFAEKFAATFNAPYVDYEAVMAVAGQNSTVSDSYTGYMLRELFKTGHTIVFDGPSATRNERNALSELAASAGYVTLFVWVQTDRETAKSRFIKASRKLGHRVSDSRYEALANGFTAPIAKEHPYVVISGKHTYATQAKAVLKNLASTKQIIRAKAAHAPHHGPANGKRNITIR